MARSGLGIDVQRLAQLAGVGKNSVTSFEKGRNSTVKTIRKIETALMAAGATFLPDTGKGPGVMVRGRQVNPPE